MTQGLTSPPEGAVGARKCQARPWLPAARVLITPFLHSTDHTHTNGAAFEKTLVSHGKEGCWSINVFSALRNIKVKSVNEQ